VADDAPLHGLLVADFSRVLAGPLATMTLADLGADVVKVERPGAGDDTRSWGPPEHPREGATYYLGLNRGKRSVALDLTDPGDHALALELVARADVLVESFRPGTMAKLGLDPAELRRAHPRLVTCTISAFGTGEAARALPGYDLLLQAMGGIMSVTGEPEGRPLKTGTALVDMLCGLFAANGILAALRARERDGTGQHVEVSLLDASLAGLLNLASGYLNAGVVPGRMGNDHPSIVPYGTYEAADGPFALAVGSDGLFARLCSELGRQGLAEDDRFRTNTARLAHRAELDAELGTAFAATTAGEWVTRLRAAGVPVGPVNDVAQAFAFAESLDLDPVDETGGVRTVRSPVRLSRTPAHVARRPPRLDEHGDDLRSWLRQPRDG
jgi:crotonobetainyl-CoA:carnitine CoA-transferase CaiB-like acyl-CoA transferase